MDNTPDTMTVWWLEQRAHQQRRRAIRVIVAGAAIAFVPGFLVGVALGFASSTSDQIDTAAAGEALTLAYLVGAVGGVFLLAGLVALILAPPVEGS